MKVSVFSKSIFKKFARMNQIDYQNATISGSAGEKEMFCISEL